MDSNPHLILLFAGKRKSGKDYVTDILISRLSTEKSAVIKISAPIKSYWAQCHNLSMQELLSSGSLKEQHRQEMIRWSEEKRNKDYGIFCREAVHMYNEILPLGIEGELRLTFNAVGVDRISSSVLEKELIRFSVAFLNLYIKKCSSQKPIWIVSDIRRKSDIQWFRENYPNKVKTIKVSTSETSRKKRGWKFTKDIDDAPTECDLDNVYDWDWQINNDDDVDSNELSSKIDELVQFISLYY